MNPWCSIWFKPRQTIRAIVDQDPGYCVLPLAVAAGMATLWMQFGGLALEAAKPMLIAAVLLGGALMGVLWLFIFGWLYRWVGSWFGGQAKNADVRAAIAWAEMPMFLVFGLWIPFALFLRSQNLPAKEPTVPTNDALAAFLVFAIVIFGSWLWRVILASQTLGEVHRFSAWKGFGTLVIPNAVLVVPVFILAMLAAIAIPNVLRGRIAANESASLGYLRALVSSLEMYRAVENAYPASNDWAKLYPPAANPAFGPPGFQTPGALFDHVVQSYRYTYASAGGTEYSLRAVPEAAPVPTRSFYTDESGRIRHCQPYLEFAMAGATDSEITDDPRPCSQQAPASP